MLIASDGWILDDELTHYRFSHDAWGYPLLLLDVWTRPGRSLVHFPVAWSSLTACPIYTLGLACLVVWTTTLVAKQLRISRWWLIPLMLWFQPWFAELSFGVLTQTPFCLAWILGIYFHLSDRPRAAALSFGFLALIRHEGIAITAGYGLVLLWLYSRAAAGSERSTLAWTRPRVLAALVCLPVPTVLFNLMYFAVLHTLPSTDSLSFTEVLKLLPFTVYFDTTPDGRDMYGTGDLSRFLGPTVWEAGPAVVLLSLLGSGALIQKWRRTYLLASYPAYFCLHSIIFWRGWFASGGYAAFLMPMAPFFALAATVGLSRLEDWSSNPEHRSRHFAGLATVALVTASVLFRLWPGTGPEPSWRPDGLVVAFGSALLVVSIGLWLLAKSGDPLLDLRSPKPGWILLVLILIFGLAAEPHLKQEYEQALEDAASWVRENRRGRPPDSLAPRPRRASPRSPQERRNVEIQGGWLGQ